MLGYPKVYGEEKDGISQDLSCWILGFNVIRSVTGFGQKSGNRHFAKRVSPLRVNH